MKKVLLGLVIIGMVFLCSCSLLEIEANEIEFEDLYSRETVDDFVSGYGFGKGRTDVVYVVLDYVYHDSMFEEKYGNDFCVDDIGGSDEGRTFFFLWLYEAHGDYFVDINGDTWWISVSKSYFGKWEVIGCSQENNTEDSPVSSTDNPENSQSRVSF